MDNSIYMTRKECEDCRKNARMSAESKEEFGEIYKLNQKMQNEVTQIKEEQIKQGEELKYMRVTMSSLDMKMTEFIKSSDTRYASKLAERVVYAMAGMILVSFMGGLITLIIK